MLDGDVTDQFHHVYGFAYTGTTEQTHLTAFCKRANQVDNLDACFQQIVATSLLSKGRRRTVNAPALFGVNWTGFVDRVAENVHDPA